MSGLEITLFVAWTLWWGVCCITAVVNGRGLGWGVAAALVPPLYLVLLRPASGTPKRAERVRCPRCRMGWVPLERMPHTCTGCGAEIPHAELQKEMHKDMM